MILEAHEGAHTASPCSAGVYNEAIFRGVDYAIAQAAHYNIRLIIAFGTNWEVHDGVPGVRISTFGLIAPFAAVSVCYLDL